MLKINIRVTKHNPKKHKATAEWWINKRGVLQVRVSDLGNLNYIKLHILHEIFEAFACTYNKNVALDVAEHFDNYTYQEYVKRERRSGREPGIDEVGFHPDCPYHDEHMAATGVEMLLAPYLKVKWVEYDNRCREVSKGIKTPRRAQFKKRRKK